MKKYLMFLGGVYFTKTDQNDILNETHRYKIKISWLLFLFFFLLVKQETRNCIYKKNKIKRKQKPNLQECYWVFVHFRFCKRVIKINIELCSTSGATGGVRVAKLTPQMGSTIASTDANVFESHTLIILFFQYYFPLRVSIR